MNSKLIKLCLVLFFISLAIYSNSLTGKFLFDDINLIQKNETIRNPSNLFKVFRENFFFQEKNQAIGYYRPLIILSFMLNYSLWKLSSVGYHLTNLLFHTLNAMLVLGLIYLIFKDIYAAFFAALFFLIHPIHTTAVSYVSGRTDLISASFILSAFTAFIYFSKRQTKIYLNLSLVLFALALFCKETSIMFPFLILLYSLIFIRKEERKLPYIYSLLFFLIALLFLIIRKQATELPPQNILFENLPLRLLTINKIIVSYLLLLFIPYDLHFERFTQIPLKANFSLILSLLIVLVLIVLISRNFKKHKQLLFFALWFFLFLFPVSQIIPIYVQGYLFTAEHFLYIPSIGFFVFFVLLIKQYLLSLKNKTLLRILSITISLTIIYYLLTTISTNRYFKDPVAFYKHNLKFTPQSTRLRNNLGFTYYNLNKLDKAIEEYEKNLAGDPLHTNTWYNLGNAHLKKGEFELAIESFQKAIKLNPHNSKFYNNLSVALLKNKNYPEALTYQKKALSLNPNDADYIYNLGLIYFEKGNLSAAKKQYQQAIKFNSTDSEYFLSLAGIYFIKKNYSKALEYNLEALKLNPESGKIYYNLGMCYLKLKQRKKAKISWEKILRLNPQSELARRAKHNLKKFNL